LGKEGKLSLIEISALCNTCPIEEIVAQISEKLPNAKVSAVKQSVKSKMHTVDQFASFSLGISALVVFIGALIVLTTMMSSVSERTREIGIFRAIGFRKSHIMRVILLEVLIVGIIGGVAGYLTGFLGAWLIAPRMAELSVPVVWNPYLAVYAVLLAIVISQLASLYPAIKASKLDPVKALRFI
jgi:putative ABC transport system permease protein